jgi:hypothetical protein
MIFLHSANCPLFCSDRRIIPESKIFVLGVLVILVILVTLFLFKNSILSFVAELSG